MQELAYLDWVLLGLICTITAAAAVYWMAPQRATIGVGPLDGPDGVRDKIFIFDGPNLIDASAMARTIFPADNKEFNWTRLHDALAGEYPDFPQSPQFVRSQGSLTIPASGKGGLGDIHCEWIDGITRVHLHRKNVASALPDTVAQRQETLRLAMEQAPYPIWHVDQHGNLNCSNTAYGALCRKVGKDDREPLFSIGPGKGLVGNKTRASVGVAGSEKKLWFDVSVVQQDIGFLCYAVDVNAVVDAEIAQRNFVQTLAKTFAQLPIGLAIFDRNRQLALFNPALIDLTALPADFLSARPNLLSFFDRLRDQRMMPEPKNYGSWRHQMADLVAAAADGRYQETWTLPSGAVYSVSGRPHPDGAVAFLFEDITAEITLTRRFRTDLEINQSMIDQMDDAIVVFSENGALNFSNAAYRKIWSVDPEASFVQMSVLDATRTWQGMCQATPVLGEIREFVGLRKNRVEWWGEIQLKGGQSLSCCVFPISHGATMVVFSRDHPDNPLPGTTPSELRLENIEDG